ncbi:ABC transporter permease [Candidatus Chlorohelix sp.]|uniref:ABC transporter permease n=1 Tax=Candidatus Chlorohelix sp. TaxID=3139201 RepID=UPI0030744AF5
MVEIDERNESLAPLVRVLPGGAKAVKNRLLLTNRLLKRRISIPVILGLLWFVLLLTGPLFIRIDPNRIDLYRFVEPPSFNALLGTDENGRDVLARVLAGARVSLIIGFSSAAISLLLGTAFGSLAGYLGGWLDNLIMRFVDFSLAVPTIIIILLVAAVYGAGEFQLILTIGLTGWMPVARLARGQVRELKEMLWVEASQSIGASASRILIRGIMPALGPVLFIAGVSELRRAVILEATASFLGAGILLPNASWGNMLTSAQVYLLTAPWLALAPGFALSITLLVVGNFRAVVAAPRLKKKERVA